LRTDENGLIPDALDEVLQTHRIKFVYLVPTFQNPTGKTIPLDRRKAIAEIIVKHKALLIEDDPYSALRCRGNHIPPIKTLAPENTVYTSTFSKILSPGLRVGFCVAPDLIKRWMVLAKQGIDLHTGTFSQALAAEYLSGGYLDRHLPKIVAVYRRKLEAMLAALKKHFSDDFKWSKPEGGMFIWAEGPRGLDTEKLYEIAVRRKVVFIPGKYFFTSEGQGQEAMRLNYTMADDETIDRAIKTLAEVIAEEYGHYSSGGMSLAGVWDGSVFQVPEMKSLPDNLKFEARME
jgi:2-aminoadipate transaminase